MVLLGGAVALGHGWALGLVFGQEGRASPSLYFFFLLLLFFFLFISSPNFLFLPADVFIIIFDEEECE